MTEMKLYYLSDSPRFKEWVTSPVFQSIGRHSLSWTFLSSDERSWSQIPSEGAVVVVESPLLLGEQWKKLKRFIMSERQNGWIFILRSEDRENPELVELDLIGDDNLWETSLSPEVFVRSIRLAESARQFRSVFRSMASKEAKNPRVLQLGWVARELIHEIQNPLAIIVGRAELLEKRVDGNPAITDRIRDDIRGIIKAASRTSDIVKTARASLTGEIRIGMKQELLLNLLEEVREFARILDPKIEMEFQCPSDLTIQCRAGEILQLFHNLVRNSFEAFKAQTGLRILIEAERTEGRIVVTYNDFMPGSDFRRTLPETSTKPYGLGVGLDICSRIAFEHKAQLNPISGERGFGWILEFKDGELSTVESPRAEGKVLIVDDEPDIGQLISESLRNEGYSCHVETNSKRALEHILNHHVDVVISDIVMPEFNGFQLERMSQAVRSPRRPPRFIFVTALRDAKLKELDERRQNPVLYKPFEMSELKQLLQWSQGSITPDA